MLDPRHERLAFGDVSLLQTRMILLLRPDVWRRAHEPTCCGSPLGSLVVPLAASHKLIIDMLDFDDPYLFECPHALFLPLLTNCLGRDDNTEAWLWLCQLDHHYCHQCLPQSHFVATEEDLKVRLLAKPMALSGSFLLPWMRCWAEAGYLDRLDGV